MKEVTSLPSSAVIAGPVPLYGTCTMSILSDMVSSVIARCVPEPSPAEA